MPYGQTVACYEHRCKEKAEGKYVEVRTPDGVWHACDGSQAVLQVARTSSSSAFCCGTL